MSNHCHALLKPKKPSDPQSPEPIPFEAITKRIKGYRAREANKHLGTYRNELLARSFDHWVRNQQEFDRVVAYIENNPVKAGLVRTAAEWEFRPPVKGFVVDGIV